MNRCLPLFLLLTLTACGRGFGDADAPQPRAVEEDFFTELPAHFPKPVVPTDNPMTRAKVELGRHLFYDPRLSGNGQQSCSTCHLQAHAFTDGLATSVGSTGDVHPRNAQMLANTVYNASLNWANPQVLELETQHLTPITGTAPVELGLNDGNRAEVLARFAADARYQALFAAAFPGEPNPYTLDHIVRALASFSRTLLSYRAPIDRFMAGDNAALNDSAQRGMALFNSERLECNQCHGGFNFSDSTRVRGDERPVFHNTGLYNILVSSDGIGDNYPPDNQGLFDFTGDPGDRGFMRAPTLRNIALTAPYNHDGSTATLSDVLDNYARGGRLVLSPAARAGDGRTNNLRDGELHGFTLTETEKTDLLAFLESLTDTEFINDPKLADPFQP